MFSLIVPFALHVLCLISDPLSDPLVNTQPPLSHSIKEKTHQESHCQIEVPAEPVNIDSNMRYSDSIEKMQISPQMLIVPQECVGER